MSVEELQARLETLQRSHEALLKSITQSNATFSPPFDLRRTSSREERDVTNAVFADSTASTVSDDSDDENDSYFVQGELPSQSFDHEHLREHLKRHSWTEHGRQILANLFTDRGRLKEPSLFPTNPGPAEDRSHYSHFQVYDVGPTGVVEPVESSGKENTMSRANQIWHSLKDIGAGASKVQSAVGRITIAREPSPILFGALHLTMNNTFDMDELFKHLVLSEASSAHMHRAFYQDKRHQKTFFFNFEYYTTIGEDCKPMQWQLGDKAQSLKPGHIPLSRCSSVVALALYDDKPRRLKNSARRARTREGWVQNIWSPWQVLVIECFPDWKATTNTFDTKHRFLNGPEAFLHALLTEYKDARKRFDDIYRRISKLVTPPADFLFIGDLRDQRLFEDRDFTWTRRYFFAHQTLGNVNDSIKSMVDAFEDVFTDDVWKGKSNTLWPLFEESSRNDHWRRRLNLLRLQFESEMKELRLLVRENNERRAEIRTLQDHLFSGTSIQESRKSVELTDMTVQQGYNIKLLTLVNMIFVPLTFVTSVYGMTNMDTEPHYWQFGVTLATVCVPFFLLIGFLNTESGYKYWARKTKAFWRWIRSEPKEGKQDDDTASRPPPVSRTFSTEEGMTLRLGEWMGRRDSDARPSHPNIAKIVEEIGERKGSGSEGQDTEDNCSEGPKLNSKASVKEGVTATGDTVIQMNQR